MKSDCLGKLQTLLLKVHVFFSLFLSTSYIHPILTLDIKLGVYIVMVKTKGTVDIEKKTKNTSTKFYKNVIQIVHNITSSSY